MENDTVRTTGDNTLVDMWIDGKLRAIAVSRQAIEAFLRLPPDRAAALSDDDRNEFVRTHLALILQAAAERLRDSDPGASSVAIGAGQLRQGTSRSGERRQGGDRRKGDRRKGQPRAAAVGRAEAAVEPFVPFGGSPVAMSVSNPPVSARST